jgi:uncharacterized protein involved in type VI secretion and phage assembly
MAAQIITDKTIANAIVSIGREEVDYVSLSIDQSFGEHHRFSLVLDYDAMKKNFLGSPLEQIALIGQWVHVELQQGDDSGQAYEFKGIIDHTSNEGREGRHGYLVIEGKSPTVLLERGKRLDIFSNMTLQKVFDNVTEGILNKALSCVNQPTYESPVPFLMQYYESDWEFLQRLSAITGETLYYTGYDLVFGTHDDFPTMEVMYDREISHIRFNSRLLNNTFIHYQYLADKDEFIEQASPDKIENANEHVDAAFSQSSQTIDAKRPVRTPISLPVEDVGSLIEMVKHKKVETAAQTVYVTGVSKTCHPRIGRLLKIRIPEGLSDAGELGTYRVVKVKHQIDQNHRYQCEFEAVPAGLKYRPTPEVKMPVAGSMPAVVTRNDDPLGLGRVQVEFLAVNDMRSELWMRVMTPDGGGLVGFGSKKGEVAKNRGIVFIPEVGDQVMIGFEYGDTNRPYVMGSMFHGKNAEGGGEGNHVKSITDKSGNTVVLNSKEGSIKLFSKKGSSTVLLDGKGNISISTPKTVTISASDINLNAGNSINLKAQPQKEGSGEGTFSLTAKKSISVTAETDTVSIQALDSSISLSAKTELTASSEDAIKIQAATDAKLDGTDIQIAGSSSIKIESSDTDII